MREFTPAEQFAIAAIARHFSATWQSGGRSSNAYLTVGRKRVALEVAVLAQPSPEQKHVAKARLREDKVALRVLRKIESAVSPHVPAGKAVVLTFGAPIKVANQLIAALTDILLAYLENGAEATDIKKSILGNRVRFCVLNDRSKWKTKVVGFVFTGDPAPSTLANVMHALHDAIAVKSTTRMPQSFAGECWLVLSSGSWIADIKTYRRVYAQLSAPHRFKKILMVSAGGRVEAVAEH